MPTFFRITMDLIIVNLIVIALVGLFLCGYFFVYRPLVALKRTIVSYSDILAEYRTHIKATEKALGSVEKRIDAIFVVEPPASSTPNQVTKTVDMGVEFSEDNPLDLPKELKFEIEGGDTAIPPQYAS